MQISFNEQTKHISANGYYSIHLSEPLSDISEDLNLYKIASNYLLNVPLLDPPYSGDTGDMEYALVEGNGTGFPLFWNPVENLSYFSENVSDSLNVYVSSKYNNIDTAAQGYEPIEAAWKPSITLILAAQDEAMITFGAIYNLQHATEFWSDNIGITPLILNSYQQMDFSFDPERYSTTDEPSSSNDKKLNDQPQFSVYPNPLSLSNKRNNSELTIEFDHSILSRSKGLTLNIFNIKGQKITSSRIVSSSNKKKMISKNTFPSPVIYILCIGEEKFTLLKKYQ